MALGADDLAALSRLLDVALALAPEARESWLQALPERHRHLLPKLRKAIEQQRKFEAGAHTRAPFATLPRLAGNEPSAVAGERIGPYVLLRELGQGGMGAVWLADRADGAFERRVALKLPRARDEQALAAQIVHERGISARLEHPQIARLYDAGIDASGRPYIAMEFVEGRPIDRHCIEAGSGLRDIVALFRQVLGAVGYAHGRLVVHRDLKPANVLVSAVGPVHQVHLLDFGVAQLLGDAAAALPGGSTGTPMLTPQYAAPEQIAGRDAGVASDLYSLGVLLHELLVGDLPQPAGPSGEVQPASRHPKLAKAPHRQRALRGDLDAILAKAMRFNPAERYATAQAFDQDLRRWLEGLPVSAAGGGRLYVAAKFARRQALALALAALALVLLVAAVSTVVIQELRARDAAARTRLANAFLSELFRADLRGPQAATPGAGRAHLVERGAAVIGSHFASDRPAQAELFGLLAAVCSDMGAWRLASDYAGRQVDLLVRGGAAQADQERAELLWAQALLNDHRPALAEPVLARMAARRSPRDEFGAAAHVLRARALFALGRQADARAAIGVLEAARDPRLAGAHRTEAWISALRAEDLMADDRLEEALAKVRQAVELGQRAEGPTSLLATEVRLHAAAWLRGIGDAARADAFFAPAAATLRARGGPHAVRAAQESARHAWQLYSVGAAVGYLDAAGAIESARRQLDDLGDMVPPSMRDQVDFWLGEIRLDWGDLAGAAALMNPIAEGVLARTELPADRYAIVTALAYLARDLGRHDDADRWLRQRQQLRRDMGRGHLPYAADDYMLIALNLSMAGRHDEAEKALAAAPRFDPIQLPGWRPQKYNDLIREARTRVYLDRGLIDLALRELPARAVDAHDDSAGLVSLRVLRGQAWCASGRPREGLALLQEQIERVGRDAHPHKPELAWLRGRAAECALAAGQREQARGWAEQARQALMALSEVAPFFRGERR